MSLPDGYSMRCKNEECGSYNIDSPYCEDCARKKLEEARIYKKTIDKVLKILYKDN